MWLIYCRLLLQGAHHAMTAALKHGRIFPHRVSLMKNKLLSVLPGSPLFRCLFWKVTGAFFSIRFLKIVMCNILFNVSLRVIWLVFTIECVFYWMWILTRMNHFNQICRNIIVSYTCDNKNFKNKYLKIAAIKNHKPLARSYWSIIVELAFWLLLSLFLTTLSLRIILQILCANWRLMTINYLLLADLVWGM